MKEIVEFSQVVRETPQGREVGRQNDVGRRKKRKRELDFSTQLRSEKNKQTKENRK